MLENIRSKYILEQVAENIKENTLLKLIKYNKNLQSRLNKDFQTYKNYYNQIVIEVTPGKRRDLKTFINIEKDDKQYFHFYFNEENKEAQETNIDYNTSKIIIKIDKEIKSFKGLFRWCSNIEKIKFIKFKRKDITDMSYMFAYCTSLNELILNEFHTDNVTDMSHMFMNCGLLKEINLKNFKTDKVINMSNMFLGCSSLQILDVGNLVFNKELSMFCMFHKCSEELKNKLKSQRNDFFNEAFFD